MFSIQNAIITGGDFRQQTTHVRNSDSVSSAIRRLQSQVAYAAFHDSAQRIDVPRCHPNTRIAVQQKAHRWAMRSDSATARASVLWLSGGAGAGKSAIAQSLAEQWADQGILLATFFFSRSDSSRNHVGTLIATIVAQIYQIMPPTTRELILRAIEDDPLIWSRDIVAQFQVLIAKPLHDLTLSQFFQHTNSPRVLIIDGLDECLDHRMRGRILHLVYKALYEWHLPFIFVIASRSEPDIISGFEAPERTFNHFRIHLDEDYAAILDIDRFLRDRFAECRQKHPLMQYIPPDWPSNRDILNLVRKSSGHFIYASTVVKYVTSTRHRPHKRLDTILSLRATTADTPFSELDALYSNLLSSAEDLPLVRRILSLHLLVGPYSVDDIERLLDLEPGEVSIALCDLTSIIGCKRGPDESWLQILHASFGEYLFDPSRSGHLYMDKKDSYHALTIVFLRAIMACKPQLSMYCALEDLEKCFQRADIDRRISDYMAANFSWSVAHSRALQAEDTTRAGHAFHQLLFATLTRILRILGHSTNPHIQCVRNLLRTGFDEIVSKRLDCLPRTDHIILNAAIIAMPPNYALKFCLDNRFLTLSMPDTIRNTIPRIPFLGHRKLTHYVDELSNYFASHVRSKTHAAGPETFARAAMYCFRYLCAFTTVPILPCRLSLMRKIFPWKWTRKSRLGLYHRVKAVGTPWKFTTYYGDPGNEIYALIDFYLDLKVEDGCFLPHWERCEEYWIALNHLIQFLPRAGRSPRLIEMCKTKQFSPLSRQLPQVTRNARRAIRKYLKRCGM